MSIVTIRANQNSYPFTTTGGTRNPHFEEQDRVAFMDAIEARRTPILDSIRKGAATNVARPRWALHSINPRGTVFGAAALIDATSITLPTGHAARFQQGHVLMATDATGQFCRFWVNDDPGNDTLTVTPIDTQLAFEAGDEIKIIGIAMPQGSDFPLAPVSRGHDYFNRWQEFSKAITHTHQSRKTPSVDRPKGSDLMDRDFLDIGKDIKEDLDRTLLLGFRKAGSASPDGPQPEFMGGLLEMAELSGNVYNVGGSDILLTHEVLEFVQNDLDDKVGSRAGDRYVMSWRTKQIFNRLMSPLKYNAGVTGNTVSSLWDTLKTEYEDIHFTHMKDFPDGVILVYSPKNLKYCPFTGADWVEKEFPTKGLYSWRGMAGIYTLIAEDIPGMALIRGFDTNLGHYPSLNRPSTFLA